MSRQSKTQWEFGELFPKATGRQVFSVSELTLQLKRSLEKQFAQVWVSGEVTNLRAQSSGHCYFTLKDANAQLSCVLFRNEPGVDRSFLQDGRMLLLQGDLTVYEPRGQYQIVVHAVELQGAGALQVAFEKLKLKLQSEGLFAQERKRPLPACPERIGIVTSPTGAALQDVLHVVQRRQPGLKLVLAPCRVQGTGAAQEIAAAIRLLNEYNSAIRNPQSAIQLILVTRGGGSLEDLWAFNEEVVARAIFESALPVVSAVGHEIDFSISDFVADVRAATPSAAAEIITAGAVSAARFLDGVNDRMAWLAFRKLEEAQEALRQMQLRLERSHPQRKLNEKLQLLDDLQISLGRALRVHLRQRRQAWQGIGQRFLRLKPSKAIELRSELATDLERRLGEQVESGLQRATVRLATAMARLRLLSPENVLERGYSITSDAATGRIIRAASEVAPGQKIKTRVKSGEISSVVGG